MALKEIIRKVVEKYTELVGLAHTVEKSQEAYEAVKRKYRVDTITVAQAEDLYRAYNELHSLSKEQDLKKDIQDLKSQLKPYLEASQKTIEWAHASFGKFYFDLQDGEVSIRKV